MPVSPPIGRTARHAAALAISAAASRFPNQDPEPLDTRGLADPRDVQLAIAVHRATLQRWLTLDYLLNRFLKQPLHQTEPALQGVLLTGAAQLLCLDRIPSYAVVDESVQLAATMVRRGAGGLTNAVLRKLASLIEEAVRTRPWTPAANRVPMEEGFVPLSDPCLPDPTTDMPRHLSIVTSQRIGFVEMLIDQVGEARAIELCRHGLLNPPVIVATESGVPGGALPASEDYEPHAIPGFVVWLGAFDRLQAFLAADARRRVQDPAASLAVEQGVVETPRLILDYCAGRGTKTRQLASRFPDAQVLATDPDAGRFADLCTLATRLPNVEPVPWRQRQDRFDKLRFDLLLLDVPCSNTAVLARRPEARYRYCDQHVSRLVGLQRAIVDESLTWLSRQGTLLYSTCSLDPRENQAQARWITKRKGLLCQADQLTLPEGASTTYHDGGYFARFRQD